MQGKLEDAESEIRLEGRCLNTSSDILNEARDDMGRPNESMTLKALNRRS
jgi:hypothetical protein